MIKLALLMFFLASGLRLSVSQFQYDSQECQDRNLSYGYIETKTMPNCSYWAIIYANSLPKLTGENLGIQFGDHNGNKVSVSKLRIPRSSFEQSPMDIFQMNGACLSRIYYLSLRRYGEKGDWRPETVQIQGMMKDTTPFDIDYKFSKQPSLTWYGLKWRRSPLPKRLDPQNNRIRNGFIHLKHG